MRYSGVRERNSRVELIWRATIRSERERERPGETDVGILTTWQTVIVC